MAPSPLPAWVAVLRWFVCVVGLSAASVYFVGLVTPTEPRPSGREGQCDAQDRECGGVLASLAPDTSASDQVLAEGSFAAEVLNDIDSNSTEVEQLLSESSAFWRIGIVLTLLAGVVVWILFMTKFAIDGSLPARLAMWGFLPEVYAAISVRAVVALLQLKTTPTPTIALRSCVTDEGAQELAEGLRKHPTAGLEALEMPHNPHLGQAGIRALVDVAREAASQLQELDFSYNPQLSSCIVPELLPLLLAKASKINTLKLMDCGLSQAELQELADGLKNSSLRRLDLSLNNLTGAGEALSAVCEAPVLEEIVLKYCGLSVEDVGALAEHLPYTSIKTLQLGGNCFGRPGLEALVKHLPDCQVDELGLENNELEAKDLSALGEAWAKRPFAHARLNGNRMTYEEVSKFVSTLKSMRA